LIFAIAVSVGSTAAHISPNCEEGHVDFVERGTQY